MKTIFDGSPSLIIKEGKVNFNEMIKQRYSLDDLLLALRQKGVKSLKEMNQKY